MVNEQLSRTGEGMQMWRCIGEVGLQNEGMYNHSFYYFKRPLVS